MAQELRKAIQLNNRAVSLMLSATTTASPPAPSPSSDGSAVRCFRQSLSLLRLILIQRTPSQQREDEEKLRQARQRQQQEERHQEQQHEQQQPRQHQAKLAAPQSSPATPIPFSPNESPRHNHQHQDAHHGPQAQRQRMPQPDHGISDESASATSIDGPCNDKTVAAIQVSSIALQHFNATEETNFFAFTHPIFIPQLPPSASTCVASLVSTETIQIYCTAVMINIAFVYHRRAQQLSGRPRAANAYQHAEAMYKKVLLCSQPQLAFDTGCADMASTIGSFALLHAMAINNLAFLYKQQKHHGIKTNAASNDMLVVLDRLLFTHSESLFAWLGDDIIRELHLNIFFHGRATASEPSSHEQPAHSFAKLTSSAAAAA